MSRTREDRLTELKPLAQRLVTEKGSREAALNPVAEYAVKTWGVCWKTAKDYAYAATAGAVFTPA